MKKRVKASYTVEMTLLSGVWLLVILGSFLLILGSYEKTEGVLRAWETGLCRSFEKALEEDRKENWQETGEETDIVKEDHERVFVKFNRNLKFPYKNLEWVIQEEIQCRILRPVDFIRKVQKVQKIEESIKGE